MDLAIAGKNLGKDLGSGKGSGTQISPSRGVWDRKPGMVTANAIWSHHATLWEPGCSFPVGISHRAENWTSLIKAIGQMADDLARNS